MSETDNLWMLAPLLACESPIEEAFLRALIAHCQAQRLTAVVLDGDCAYPVTENFGRGFLLQVRCQFQVAKYRFDFVLELLNRTLRSSGILVVECDGHEYHERTKDQAIRDRSRDREIQRWGGWVFRFTGRDIHQDAANCADQCVSFLEAKLAGRGDE